MNINASDAKELLSQIRRNSVRGSHWAFDCDGTLVTGHVCSHTNWMLLRERGTLPEGKRTFRHYLAHLREVSLKSPAPTEEDWTLAGQVGVVASGIYHWETRLHIGLHPEALTNAALQSLDEGEKEGSMLWVESVSDLARGLDLPELQTWIVSGSPHPCVRAVAQRLGIPEARVLASRLRLSHDGTCGEIFEHPGILWEDVKLDVFLKSAGRAPELAAGDSIGDLALLKAAERWAWCVIWNGVDVRGEAHRSFRDVLNGALFGGRAVVPEKPGVYTHTDGGDDSDGKLWIFDVRTG